MTDISTAKGIKKVETVSKLQKIVNIKDSEEKSITLFFNKESNILTPQGKSSYTLIQFITLQGQLAKETKNSNSIKISDLPKGNYMAFNIENHYYKFVKF